MNNWIIGSKCRTKIQAINRAIMLHMSHRFHDDLEYGKLLRRFCYGYATKGDIKKLNTCFLGNSDVKLPPACHIRYACATNSDRNAVSSSLFLKHLEKTHQKTTNLDVQCPAHTVIIKGTFKYSAGKRKIAASLRNVIYDTCGDNDVKSGRRKFDPVLKFFYDVPLMMTSNDRIDEKLGNSTPIRGLYLVRRRNAQFIKEVWNGYVVNTIEARDIEYIVCKKEKDKESDDDEYFLVEPEQIGVHIRIPFINSLPVKGITMEQLLIY